MSVLFTSDHSLERAENLRAIYEHYPHEKHFAKDSNRMACAERAGYKVVVCDTLPKYIDGKDRCKCVVIGHGITGDKKYALDEQRTGIDKRAFPQIDYLVNASDGTAQIAASQFGIPLEKVVNLGMPRTDAYVGKSKGDGGTFLAKYRRAYLYAPTFRGPFDGDRLPRIDWAKLNDMLEDDELIAVKRHYYTGNTIVGQNLPKVGELSPMEASAPYLMDCDVLLTDYSSILFDAYLLGKPSVLTVDDMDAYMAKRGMYLDYPAQYSSRWLKAEGNEEQLLAHLRAACVTGMRNIERKCVELVADKCDGNSCERIAELIWRLVCES